MGFWQVVGGAEKGGIVVRGDASELLGRLGTGAVVQELERLENEENCLRLRFRKLQGAGCQEGWVSSKLASGKELLVKLDGVLWQNQKSLVVREEARLTSKEIGRLETAVVRQLKLQGERLSYELVTGEGPASGWVSLSVQKKPLLHRLWSWRVEEILKAVRDLNDMALKEAFSLLVKDDEVIEALQELHGEDFRIRRKALRCLARLGVKAASDPDETVRAEAILLFPETAAAALEDPSWRVRSVAQRLLGQEVVGKEQLQAARETSRLRVVALHGASSNSAVLKFQLRRLQMAMDAAATVEGNSIEWVFLDSPMIFQPVPGATDPIFREPGDIEKSISKGQPFRWWYSHGNACYNWVDQGVENLLRMIHEHAPVDIVVSFSQASNCISLALDTLRRTSEVVPWTLSVMFCGGQIDDEIFQWPPGFISSQPTLRVFNAAKDDFFASEPSLKSMYSELQEWPHHDGHGVPRSEPRASEIYSQVAEQVMRLGKSVAFCLFLARSFVKCSSSP